MLVAPAEDMKRGQPTIDYRPGPLPDIRTSGGDITFVMSPSGIDASARLIIRCDSTCGVWVSIGARDEPGAGA